MTVTNTTDINRLVRVFVKIRDKQVELENKFREEEQELNEHHG